jgi:hypothetical protein
VEIGIIPSAGLSYWGFQMRKLALAITALLAGSLAIAAAAEKAHRKHAAANHARPAPAQPLENPPTRLPVPPDTFRA